MQRRDKRQCKDVREWQETWIYCCVAFITDESLCAGLMCSCAHQTPSRKLDVGFLCNVCVHVTTCAYKYGVCISGSRQHEPQNRKERPTNREADNSMLPFKLTSDMWAGIPFSIY